MSPASPRSSSQATPESPERFADIAAVHRTLAPVMEAIAAVGGPYCDVVLHDLSSRDLEHSVYAIVNGHVSGRSVGGPSTNLGAEVLRDETKDHNAYGYRGLTADGRELISSSVYYRDLDGHEDMINEAIAAVGKPATAMGKADRIDVLRLLEDRGAFHIKRAAEKVSARLGVSRVTTYGYLDEVRRSPEAHR